MIRPLKALRNLLGPWIADDPNPEYSRLDRMDNLGASPENWEPSCAVCGLPWSQWTKDGNCHGQR